MFLSMFVIQITLYAIKATRLHEKNIVETNKINKKNFSKKTFSRKYKIKYRIDRKNIVQTIVRQHIQKFPNNNAKTSTKKMVSKSENTEINNLEISKRLDGNISTIDLTKKYDEFINLLEIHTHTAPLSGLGNVKIRLNYESDTREMMPDDMFDIAYDSFSSNYGSHVGNKILEQFFDNKIGLTQKCESQESIGYDFYKYNTSTKISNPLQKTSHYFDLKINEHDTDPNMSNGVVIQSNQKNNEKPIQFQPSSISVGHNYENKRTTYRKLPTNTEASDNYHGKITNVKNQRIDKTYINKCSDNVLKIKTQKMSEIKKHSPVIDYTFNLCEINNCSQNTEINITKDTHQYDHTVNDNSPNKRRKIATPKKITLNISNSKNLIDISDDQTNKIKKIKLIKNNDEKKSTKKLNEIMSNQPKNRTFNKRKTNSVIVYNKIKIIDNTKDNATILKNNLIPVNTYNLQNSSYADTASDLGLTQNSIDTKKVKPENTEKNNNMADFFNHNTLNPNFGKKHEVNVNLKNIKSSKIKNFSPHWSNVNQQKPLHLVPKLILPDPCKNKTSYLENNLCFNIEKFLTEKPEITIKSTNPISYLLPYAKKISKISEDEVPAKSISSKTNFFQNTKMFDLKRDKIVKTFKSSIIIEINDLVKLYDDDKIIHNVKGDIVYIKINITHTNDFKKNKNAKPTKKGIKTTATSVKFVHKNIFIKDCKENISNIKDQMKCYGQILQYHKSKTLFKSANTTRDLENTHMNYNKNCTPLISNSYWKKIKDQQKFYLFRFFEYIFIENKCIKKSIQLDVGQSCTLLNSKCIDNITKGLCEICLCVKLFMAFFDIDLNTQNFNMKKRLWPQALIFYTLPSSLWFIFGNFESKRFLSISTNLSNEYKNIMKLDDYEISKKLLRLLIWQSLEFYLPKPSNFYNTNAQKALKSDLKLIVVASSLINRDDSNPIFQLELILKIYLCFFYYSYDMSLAYDNICKKTNNGGNDNNAENLKLNFILLYTDFCYNKKIHISMNPDLTINLFLHSKIYTVNIFEAQKMFTMDYKYFHYACMYLQFFRYIYQIEERMFYRMYIKQYYKCFDQSEHTKFKNKSVRAQSGELLVTKQVLNRILFQHISNRQKIVFNP